MLGNREKPKSGNEEAATVSASIPCSSSREGGGEGAPGEGTA